LVGSLHTSLSVTVGSDVVFVVVGTDLKERNEPQNESVEDTTNLGQGDTYLEVMQSGASEVAIKCSIGIAQSMSITNFHSCSCWIA